MRLIDADEILKDKVSNAYISRFEIENAPTVEIIECKDCMFYHEGWCTRSYECPVEDKNDYLRKYCEEGE